MGSNVKVTVNRIIVLARVVGLEIIGGENTSF